MDGRYPSFNSSERDAWWVAAYNFYNYALLMGVVGVSGPMANDSVTDLARRVAKYSALIADI